jgi:uncharacterized protein
MGVEEEINSVVEFLEELKEDSSVPKNVKESLNKVIEALRDKRDVSIRVNKALHELDDLSDDPNIQSYTRMQIWNVVSMLEKIE